MADKVNDRTSESCQKLFRILLRRGVRLNPCSWIRILEQSSQCDRYYDLSTLRKKYKDALGEECLNRIRECIETTRDQRIAEQTCMHFHEETIQTINRSVWGTWWGSWWAA